MNNERHLEHNFQAAAEGVERAVGFLSALNALTTLRADGSSEIDTSFGPEALDGIKGKRIRGFVSWALADIDSQLVYDRCIEYGDVVRPAFMVGESSACLAPTTKMALIDLVKIVDGEAKMAAAEDWKNVGKQLAATLADKAVRARAAR